MSKKLDYAIQFARFCENNKIRPWVLAEIIRHANKSAAAWERNNNSGGAYPIARHEREQAAASKAAERAGFKLVWPGLYPTLVLPCGRQEHIPFE